MKKKSFLQIIPLLLIAGLATLVMTGPLSGLILKGYDFEAQFKTPLILATFAIVGRFMFAVLPMDRLRPKASELPPEPSRWKTWQQGLFLFLLLAACASVPFLGSKYWVSVLIMALIYVLLGLGLNIVVGLAGLLDLGFVGFYAVGAYGYALGFKYLDFGFWGALPMAALTAGLFGAILGFPVLRMHGDYLAIVTLGFGEIIRLVLNNWLEFTGGLREVSPFMRPGALSIRRAYSMALFISSCSLLWH
jgi:branched-chain amino acid transport system permease protein